MTTWLGRACPKVFTCCALISATGCQLVFSIDGEAQRDASSIDGGQGPDANQGPERLTQDPFAHGLFLTENYAYVTTSNTAAKNNSISRVDLNTRIASPLSTGEDAVSQVATIDDQWVYWTTWAPGTIRAVNTGGVTGAMTLTDVPNGGFAMVSDGSRILTTEYSGGATYQLTPNLASNVFDIPEAANGVTNAVLLGNELFWTNQTEDAAGGVFSIDTSDAMNVQLHALDDNRAWGLAVTPTDLVYSRRGIPGMPGTSALVRVDRGNANSFELVSARTEIRGVAIDGAYVYYCEQVPGGSIWRVALDGTSQPEELVRGQQYPMYVAVTADFIYWTNFDALSGGLYRAPKPSP